VAVFRRRLKSGATFEDFLQAWQAEKGFGVTARVFNAVRLDDEREILTFGFVDLESSDLESAIATVADQEEVRHSRIDEVIESTQLRGLYELRSEHDLSSTPKEVLLGAAGSLLHGFG